MKKKNTSAGGRFNHRHEIFINEMIKHGDRIIAYSTAYPNSKGKSISNCASDLMKNPYISGRIEDAVKRMQKDTEAALTALLNEKLDSLLGMREYLVSIVSGKTKFKKPYKSGEDVKTVDVEATASEVLRALELNLKLTRDLPKGEVSFVRTITFGENKEAFK